MEEPNISRLSTTDDSDSEVENTNANVQDPLLESDPSTVLFEFRKIGGTKVNFKIDVL